MSSTQSTPGSKGRPLDKPTAIVTLFAVFCHLLNFGVMAGTFNWPANLGENAEKNLGPIVIDHSTVSVFGYTVYALYSVLIWPVASMTVDLLRNGRDSGMLEVARGFGIASMICRMVGLIRWLIAMPLLAGVYTHEDTSQEIKDVIDLLFDLLNSYFGGIGEALGVGAFCASWLMLCSIFMLTDDQPRFPKWLGFAGVFTSVVVYLQLFEVWEVSLGPAISAIVIVNLIWFVAFAIVLLLPAKCQRSTAIALNEA